MMSNALISDMLLPVWVSIKLAGVRNPISLLAGKAESWSDYWAHQNYAHGRDCDAAGLAAYSDWFLFIITVKPQFWYR